MTTRNHAERGQLTVLTIGFLVVIGLLAVVVVDASGVYLQRRDLDNIADRLALDATDGLDPSSVYGGGAEDAVLSESDVRQAISRDAPRDVSVQVEVDGARVHITLERTARLAISPPGWPVSTRVVAEADAQLRLGTR